MGLELFKNKKKSQEEIDPILKRLNELSKELEKVGGIETARGKLIGKEIDELELEKLKKTFSKRYNLNSDQTHKKDQINNVDNKKNEYSSNLESSVESNNRSDEKDESINQKVRLKEGGYDLNYFNSLTRNEQIEFVKKERERINNSYTEYINSELKKIESENGDFKIKRKDFDFHFDETNFFILDKFNPSLKTGSGKGGKNISNLIFDKTIKLNPNLYGLDFRNNPFNDFTRLSSNLLKILSINKYIKEVKLDLTGIDEEDLDSFIEIVEKTGFNGFYIQIGKGTDEKVSQKIHDQIRGKFVILAEGGDSKKTEGHLEQKNKIKEEQIPFKDISYDINKVLKSIPESQKELDWANGFIFILDKFKKENYVALSEVIELYSNLKRAIGFIPEGHKKNTDWVKTIFLVIKKIKERLKDFNVEEISSIGKIFDHNTMEAISTLEDLSVEDGIVLKEMSPCFKMGDQVMKYSKVIVNKKTTQEERNIEILKLNSVLNQIQEIKKREIEPLRDFEVSKSSNFATFEFAMYLFKKRARSMNEADRSKYIEDLKFIATLPKKERREYYIMAMQEAFTGVSVHEKMDLDARGILFLSKIAGLKFSNFNYEKINNKGESEHESGSISYLDNSKKYINDDGSINDDILMDLPDSLVADLSQTDGLNVFKTKGPRHSSEYFMSTLDHHSKDSKKGNSATRQMFSLLLKLGLIKDLDYIKQKSPEEYDQISNKEKIDFAFIKEIVRFITREDDKYYKIESYNNSSFSISPELFNKSYKTLYGYVKFINPNTLEKIFNSQSIREKYIKNNPKVPLEFIELTDEELKELGLLQFTDNEISLEYQNQFKEKLTLPDSIYKLEREYWLKKSELAKSGKKKEKTNTRLEWLMDKSRKISIFVENKKMEEQFNRYKNHPEVTRHIDGVGKVFVQKDFHFFNNPTDMLICNGYDGYINYSGNGKKFFVSLFGDNYPEFDSDFMSLLNNNGISKIRGMLIKTDKNSTISTELFNEILTKINNTDNSLENNPELDKDSDDKVFDEDINDDLTLKDYSDKPYIGITDDLSSFLNSKEDIKDYSESVRESLSELELEDQNLIDFRNELIKLSKNLNFFRDNILLFMLSSYQEFSPIKFIELDNKKIYFSRVIQNEKNEDKIVCYVKTEDKIYPRLLKMSARDGFYRAAPFIDTENGDEEVVISESGDSINFESYPNRSRVTSLDEEILSSLSDIESVSIDDELSDDLENNFGITKEGKMEPYLDGIYNFDEELEILEPNLLSDFRSLPSDKTFFGITTAKYFKEYLAEERNKELFDKFNSDSSIENENEKLIKYMNLSNGLYDSFDFMKYSFMKQIEEGGNIDINELNSFILNIFGIADLETPKELIPNFEEGSLSTKILKNRIFGEVVVKSFQSKLDSEDVTVSFATDKDGRVWIQNISPSDNKINSYGSSSKYINAGVLLMDPILRSDRTIIVDFIKMIEVLSSKLSSNKREFIRRKLEVLEDALQVRKGSWDYIYSDKVLENIDIIRQFKSSSEYEKSLEYFGVKVEDLRYKKIDESLEFVDVEDSSNFIDKVQILSIEGAIEEQQKEYKKDNDYDDLID